MLSGKILKPII